MPRQASHRDKIIAAASDILAEENLSRLSVDRISERAGISRRTFFNYFAGKEELLTEVLKTLRSPHDRAMHEWSAELPAELGVEQRIVTIFRRIIEIISAPAWKGSAFLRLSGELADLEGHPIHAVIAEAKRDQEKWFERELSRGNYLSPSQLATQLTIIMTSLFQLQLVHRSPHLADATVSMIPTLLAAHLGTAS